MNKVSQSMMQIDPEWAWRSFEPSSKTPWDRYSAAHLFRRAGFGANPMTIDQAVGDGFEATLDALTNEVTEPPEFRTQMNSLVRAGLASGSVEHLAAQWVYRMLNTPVPLLEKATLFWHGHFATSATKVEDAELMQAQNGLLREHAAGDFAKLLLEISRDPAMLIYLDSVSNRKSHPNENYAREIMELFCLGEGNYSETDIRELARCFTGWEIKRKRFRFNRYQHDTGSKSILGQTGTFGGEDGVRIVTEQTSAPYFLTGKLARFFVSDELVFDQRLLQPLADELRQNDLNMLPTLRRILGSNLMFSAQARARKIRSPIEFAVTFLKALDASTDVYQVASGASDLGQGLYHPPSVKGWDGGRAWINSSTLLGRANMIRQLLDHEKTRFGRKSLPEYLDAHDVGNVGQLVDHVEPLLFAVPIPDSARQRIELIGEQKTLSGQPRFADALHFLCTLPEFQLS